MSTTTTQNTQEPAVVEIWNGPKVKLSLDDGVMEAIEKTDYKLDYSYTDKKLFLSFLAVAFAGIGILYSQKIPLKESRFILGICVGLYATITFIVQVVAYFYEGDIIMWANRLPVAKDGAGEKTFVGPEQLVIESVMEKYSSDYTLRFINPRAPKGSNTVNITQSIGSFLGWDGIVQQDKMDLCVSRGLKELASLSGKKKE